MKSNLSRWAEALRSSFWFVPALIVLAGMGLAAGLIAVDVSVELHADRKWPLLFGAGAAGSRGLLTAVASSMITVAGVVFSITIVALSLASSQYTSRVLRRFRRDRVNQVVLGVFVGIYAYCLVVLRTIREGSDGAFVPSMAVLGGLLLALVGIGFLIYFIHHVSISIQASSIIAGAAAETVEAIDRLYPEVPGGLVEDAIEGVGRSVEEASWIVVPARCTGYVATIDFEALAALAEELRTVVRMERGIGEFAVAGAPLVALGGTRASDEPLASRIDSMFVIGRQRTMQQDVGFGIRQIVDVALKALSPGINDSTTAVMCLDHLGAIFVRLANREIGPSRAVSRETQRVIARGPTFDGFLAEGFNQIRKNAKGNVAVLARMLETLALVAQQTKSASRRRALQVHALLVSAEAERSIDVPHDAAAVRSLAERLSISLMS